MAEHLDNMEQQDKILLKNPIVFLISTRGE